MPFKSKAQRGYMWANHPVIARRWAHETPKGRKLPAVVHRAPRKRRRAKR